VLPEEVVDDVPELGQVAVWEEKQVLLESQQKMLPAAGAGQVFWQSASMLHIAAQPAGDPPPPDVLAVELVGLLPPPEALLLELVLVAALPPPDVELDVEPTVVPPTEAPVPPATSVSLPLAQATKRTALAKNKATWVRLTCFTLLKQQYASYFAYTTVSCGTLLLTRPSSVPRRVIGRNARERSATGHPAGTVRGRATRRVSVRGPMSSPDVPAKPSALRRFFALELLDNRYPALHGLRVVAILSVLQIHCTYILAGDFVKKRNDLLDPSFIRESYWIFFGMDLFFMLSGFLIGSILLRSLELEGTQNIRRFYLRRIFRTFPSYWVVLTVLALTITLAAEQRHNLRLEYLYGTNFASLEPQSVVMIWGWSLALEEQFYLAVPLLFFVLHRLRRDSHRFALLLGLWALAPAVRLFIYLRGAHWNYYDLHLALYFRTHTRFDTLVAGILLVFVHQRYGAAIAAWFKDPFHRALVGMLSLACVWPLHNPALFGPQNVLLVYVFAWGTITSVMYFGPLLMLLGGEGLIPRALSHPVFRRIATLGYGVYLVHMPIIHYVLLPAVRSLHARGVSMMLLWPGTLLTVIVGSMSLAYALHVLVEKPSLRVRERLAA